MGASDEFSLFDPSSHKRKKSPLKKGKKKKDLPKLSEEARKATRKKLAEKDPELDEWLSKMSDFHEDLNEKIHKLLEKEGHSPQSLSRFLNDTSNFSKEQQKLINDQKKELDKTLGIKLDPALQQIKKKKKAKKATKERRGKTLGARKRWMDMR